MKNFYQLLGNTVIAGILNSTVWFAIIFYVYLQTKAVFATSIMSGIYLTTVAVTSFWFGSIVDHNKKKTVMMVANALTLLIYAGCFLIYITAPSGAFAQLNSVTLWVFVVLLLVGVIIGNIRSIALPTVITLLVEEDKRDKANGMAGTANGIAFMVTSVISGFLVGQSGMYGVLLLAMVMTLITGLHLAFIPIPEKKIVHSAESKPKIDLKGTFKVIALIPGLLAFSTRSRTQPSMWVPIPTPA